jgi:hypothetical protein
VVMPNHVHGIIVIEPGAVAEPDGGAGRGARSVPTNPPHLRLGPGQAQGPAPTLWLGI